MKTIKNIMIAMLTVFAVSCSQDDVENRPVVTPGTAPELGAPEEGNVYVLNPEQLDNLMERFVWTAATFGEGVIPNYALEVDYAGEDFDTPITVATTNGTLQVAVSNAVFNSALEQLGAVPFASADYQVRIKAFVGDQAIYSNIVEINVTGYSTEIPKLWVPGGYQAVSGYGASTWNPSAAPMLSATEFGETEYEGYVYIGEDQVASNPDHGFKFLTGPAWDGNTAYGDNGTFAGELETPGNNILANQGYYLMKVNLDPEVMSYSLTSTTWSIVGNGTPGGWDADTPMQYDPATKKWWVIATLSTQAAPDNGMKFRANNAWDLNFGDTGANGSVEYSGTNISTTAGTYRIELDLSNPRNYTYTLTAQ